MLKRLWEWIKRPHGWVLIPFYLFTAVCIAFAMLFTFLWQDNGYEIVAYILYALAAITLGYSVYTVIIVAPALKKSAVALLKKHEFTGKMYEQYGFRTIMLTVISLAISLGNAVINGTIGIMYSSLWYCALGAYYLLLSAMRGGVVIFHRKKDKYGGDETQLRIREIKTYIACGVWLVLLPLALSFAILEMVVSDMAFVRSGLMIYAAAAYTFYKIIMSVRNFVKARRWDDFTVKAVRNVNLADALVALLALQTAMFHEFSPNESFGYTNALTGGAVCALTAVIGAVMIVNGCIKIKKIRTETSYER